MQMAQLMMFPVFLRGPGISSTIVIYRRLNWMRLLSWPMCLRRRTKIFYAKPLTIDTGRKGSILKSK